MSDNERFSTAETRRLVRELRELGGVEAPGELLSSVLVRVGLGDAYWELDTPIGPVFVAYGDAGISAVVRANDAAEFERAFRERHDRALGRLAEPPAELARAVVDGLGGGGRSKLRFDLRGLSEFERAVLLKASEIPRGQVRPYAWIAREIGRPGAVRAVGSALGGNPVPLLIPCHRVVRSDGRIGGYAFGNEAKRAILASEGIAAEELERIARAGIRYYGSDTTHIYCYPTCSHARRITDRHRVPFRSEGQATAAGYRPCKVCRPVAP
jgi:O-6-methylguanine DNA methyltransferase